MGSLAPRMKARHETKVKTSNKYSFSYRPENIHGLRARNGSDVSCGENSFDIMKVKKYAFTPDKL
jgi:hypothetical protein